MNIITNLKSKLKESGGKLAIATIFSYSPNEEDPEDTLFDENFETDRLDKTLEGFS